MTNSTLTLVDSIVPEEILISGDFRKAEDLLKKEEFPSEKIAEIFYLLGNKFFSYKQKFAAELSWKRSRDISIEEQKDDYNQNIFPKNSKKKYIQLICMIISSFLFFYLFLIVFFERKPLNYDFQLQNFVTKEMSFWEEWWDSGRPSNREKNILFYI